MPLFSALLCKMVRALPLVIAAALLAVLLARPADGAIKVGRPPRDPDQCMANISLAAFRVYERGEIPLFSSGLYRNCFAANAGSFVT